MASDEVWRQEGESLVLVHGFSNVRLTLTPHSEGGLTDDDHAMAKKIDALG